MFRSLLELNGPGCLFFPEIQDLSFFAYSFRLAAFFRARPCFSRAHTFSLHFTFSACMSLASFFKLLLLIKRLLNKVSLLIYHNFLWSCSEMCISSDINFIGKQPNTSLSTWILNWCLGKRWHVNYIRNLQHWSYIFILSWPKAKYWTFLWIKTLLEFGEPYYAHFNNFSFILVAALKKKLQ